MTVRPLVTIAMPLYNAAAYLATSLGNIRAQTYDNLDILLCDNASTDATQQMCEAAAASDPRIRYLRHPQNLGARANFNTAAAMRRGEYFMWAAHDDVLEPEFVASTLAALQSRPDLVLAHTHTVLIEANGFTRATLDVYDKGIGSDDAAERVAAFLPQRYNVAFYGLMPSDVLDEAPLAGAVSGADIAMTLRLLLRGPFAIVPRPLFRYRLLSTDADYERMFQREQRGDYVLDRWRAFPRIVNESALPREEKPRIRSAIARELRPLLDDRAHYLLASSLARDPRATRLSKLLTWARQYPPLWHSRFFWGAMRRTLLR